MRAETGNNRSVIRKWVVMGRSLSDSKTCNVIEYAVTVFACTGKMARIMVQAMGLKCGEAKRFDESLLKMVRPWD